MRASGHRPGGQITFARTDASFAGTPLLRSLLIFLTLVHSDWVLVGFRMSLRSGHAVPAAAAHIYLPPQHTTRSPVTNDDWSDARNTATFATSCGLPILRRGMSATSEAG